MVDDFDWITYNGTEDDKEYYTVSLQRFADSENIKIEQLLFDKSILGKTTTELKEIIQDELFVLSFKALREDGCDVIDGELDTDVSTTFDYTETAMIVYFNEYLDVPIAEYKKTMNEEQLAKDIIDAVAFAKLAH